MSLAERFRRKPVFPQQFRDYPEAQTFQTLHQEAIQEANAIMLAANAEAAKIVIFRRNPFPVVPKEKPAAKIEPVFKPSPALSRRMFLGNAMVATGGSILLAGFGRALHIVGVEQPAIDKQTQQAYPAPSIDELKYARTQINTSNTNTEREIRQALREGNTTVSSNLPSYLQQAYETVEKQNQHDAEWDRLYRERGILNTFKTSLMTAFAGLFVGMGGLVVKAQTDNKIWDEEYKFKEASRKLQPTTTS